MKYIFSLLFASIQLFVSNTAFAQIPANFPEADIEVVAGVLQTFVEDIAKGNAQGILNVLSPDASDTLRMNIEKNITNKPIAFQTNFDTITYDEISKKLTLVGTFQANYDGAVSWNYNGVSHTVVLQKTDENWYIVESDAIEKLSAHGVLTFVIPIIVIALLLSVFWLWMFIDACLNPFNNNKNTKIRWLLCFILFNIPTAILYFFSKHRKRQTIGTPIIPQS